MKRRRVDPQRAQEAALGGEVAARGWYSRIPEPETTWPECSACGTKARILDAEHKECIKCQVRRARQARTGTAGPF